MYIYIHIYFYLYLYIYIFISPFSISLLSSLSLLPSNCLLSEAKVSVIQWRVAVSSFLCCLCSLFIARTAFFYSSSSCCFYLAPSSSACCNVSCFLALHLMCVSDFTFLRFTSHPFFIFSPPPPALHFILYLSPFFPHSSLLLPSPLLLFIFLLLLHSHHRLLSPSPSLPPSHVPLPYPLTFCLKRGSSGSGQGRNRWSAVGM